MKKGVNQGSRSEAGFSLIELMVVVLIISILVALSLFYGSAHQKLYKPDDESLQITDVLQEARQRSLTQRETMRVEISQTRGLVRLIDENRSNTADDDRPIKSVPLFPQTEVSFVTRPSNITVNPPEPIPAASAVFIQSVYPPSITESVCTLRFLSNGTVANAGNDSTGTGAVTTGVTLNVWSPNKANTANYDIARAITVIGSTGTIRLWEYDAGSTAANKWKDSRRYGTYGGGTSGNTSPTP